MLPFHNIGTDSIFGHTYALPAGYNGSRSSGSNNFNISGYSQYQDSFTNSGATPATFNFPFEITAGELAAQMDAAAAGQLWATVGETISLDYVLTSSAAGNFSSLGACTGTGIGGPPGDAPELVPTSQNITSAPSTCYNAAIGRIGDPFNPELVPQSVPEPSTLAMFGLGFAGALRLRRRRR